MILCDTVVRRMNERLHKDTINMSQKGNKKTIADLDLEFFILRYHFGIGDIKMGVLKLSYLSVFRQPALLRVLGQVVEAEAAQGLVGGSVLPQELQLADRHQVRVFPHLERRRRRRRE